MTNSLRIFMVTICLLVVACPSWAANDFSGLNAGSAVWTLDDSTGLVITDDFGNNDLTDNNTVQQDTVDYKEGNGCADHENDNDEYLTCTDGDLDAGFPGKNGGSEQDFSVLFWVQFETTPDALNNHMGLVSKYSSATERSWTVWVFHAGGGAGDKIRLSIGYNSGESATSIEFATKCVAGIWYHVAATYTASNNAMKLRIWDDNASALLDANQTGTADGNMTPDTGYVEIATWLGNPGAYCFDGQFDEVVVMAGEALSDADIDKVRAGTYVSEAAGGVPIFMYHYMNH